MGMRTEPTCALRQFIRGALDLDCHAWSVAKREQQKSTTDYVCRFDLAREPSTQAI
jgi:hypothetical protein